MVGPESSLCRFQVTLFRRSSIVVFSVLAHLIESYHASCHTFVVVTSVPCTGQPTDTLLVLSEPETVKAVLTASYRDCPKPPKYRSMEALLGKGLVTNNGESWKLHRYICYAMF